MDWVRRPLPHSNEYMKEDKKGRAEGKRTTRKKQTRETKKKKKPGSVPRRPNRTNASSPDLSFLRQPSPLLCWCPRVYSLSLDATLVGGGAFRKLRVNGWRVSLCNLRRVR